MDARREAAVSGWFALVTDFCVFWLFVAAALCLYRIVVGPKAADRAVAFDTLSSVAIGMICLLCIRFSSTLYFDAVWILTLVGFLGSSAVAKYLAKGRVF
ncbi:MAG: K+/H+ antiporter subunit F [Deltaproteobacteria bacterium]|nr:K+/H+ antiporter subunit F [Deltaproteobacteria bacterium]